jgi:hypothetical protein
MNQYEPWIAEGITEAEYFKRRYIEARQELSEALANEQSSAKAYAESQEKLKEETRIADLADDAVRKCHVQYHALAAQFAESQAREALLAKRLGPAGAEMLRDLVGVIKTLTAALNEIDDLWLDHKMPAFIAERVLASTLEIRERIGAT